GRVFKVFGDDVGRVTEGGSCLVYVGRLQVVVQTSLCRWEELHVGGREGAELYAVVGCLVLDPYEGRSAFKDAGTASQLPGPVAGDVPVKSNAGRYDQEAIGCAADIVFLAVLKG